MTHRARKRFGQNFLNDQSISNSIIRCINAQPSDNLIEIGPGLGALTKPLLHQVNRLTAIEIDTDLQALLLEWPEAKDKLQLIQGDALKVDFTALGTQQRIIGNLPYNISSPLLIRLLQLTPHIKDMHFMLQKEVVQRLAAPPGSKTYGRLSVMAQYYCEVVDLFHVPPTAFTPEPQVDSAIVRLTPHITLPYAKLEFSILEKLVAQAFSMRRKTLANNLKPLLTAHELIQLDIDPKCRPEQISVIDYVNIWIFLMQNRYPSDIILPT
jgi:16S rRNA (adenine1518-N6/adenine1519-N6)-dimethyltransferase